MFDISKNCANFCERIKGHLLRLVSISKQRRLKTSVFIGLLAMLCASCADFNKTAPVDPPFITSSVPLRIVSANDGNSLKWVWNSRSNLPDSITVIDLSPDAPPQTRTVSGTVPNTFAGDPKSAIVGSGRYAFVPNHSWGSEDKESANQVSVVDLESPNLTVIATIPLPPYSWQALAHPDGERAIIISDHKFHIFRIETGKPLLVSESEPFHLYFTSFAINPEGTSIIATAADELTYSASVELHLFSIVGDTIQHTTKIGIDPNAGEIDQPFAPRFSPDGSRVLVLNGLGIAIKPPLDAVLSVDMTVNPPLVTETIQNVAQGLESLAFHPSGKFAVITCIDGPYIGHLAVVDLTAPSMRILYYMPIEFVPQGIEFSPDGSMLFVQATTANHINVYKVDGMKLVKSPYVLRTGEGPASMALSPL